MTKFDIEQLDRSNVATWTKEKKCALPILAFNGFERDIFNLLLDLQSRTKMGETFQGKLIFSLPFQK